MIEPLHDREPPRVPLANQPTRGHWLRYGSDLGARFWIKRDDHTGSELMGNKVRKLEYLMAEAMAQPELAADPRFAGHTDRGRHQRELDELIAKWCAGYAGDELLELLHRHGVPAGRIYTAKEMLADPHFAARDAIVRLEHPDLGEFPMQNVVPKLTATPGGVRRVGPELGEHTDEVLRDVAGLDGDEISRLRAAGVV